MIRLFICTPTHFLHGGVERILESLAERLPAQGFEVTFGLVKGARFHDPEKFRRAFPAIRGIEVDGTSGTAYGRRRALRAALVAAEPDVVLIARIFDAYPVCSELKHEGHRLRLAVTVQGYEPEYFVDLARYADFVDLCVANGELGARAVARFARVPAERIRAISGGVVSPRRTREAQEGPLRLAYVGRLEQIQKRARDLPLLAAELCRRSVPAAWHVAGDGTLDSELRAQMPHARFHGWLSTADLYDRVYADIDVLVHFAAWEGVPIVPREAMAHGVVPVMSRFTGLDAEAQFLDGANALTFPVGDLSAAADAIERLHHDRALLERLSRAARESQGGIRSAAGAVAAWADAFRETVAAPARVAAVVPAAPADAGFLTRVGVPPALAEGLRRLRGRRHTDPGAEWPHWSGLADDALAREIQMFGRG